jgi:hypothetical protein
MRKRVKAKLMDPTPFATVITDLTESKLDTILAGRTRQNNLDRNGWFLTIT